MDARLEQGGVKWELETPRAARRHAKKFARLGTIEGRFAPQLRMGDRLVAGVEVHGGERHAVAAPRLIVTARTLEAWTPRRGDRTEARRRSPREVLELVRGLAEERQWLACDAASRRILRIDERTTGLAFIDAAFGELVLDGRNADPLGGTRTDAENALRVVPWPVNTKGLAKRAARGLDPHADVVVVRIGARRRMRTPDDEHIRPGLLDDEIAR